MKNNSYFYGQRNVKLVHLLGASQTGKTSLLRRILGKPFKKAYSMTETMQSSLEQRQTMNIYYYDTPGKEQLAGEIDFINLTNLLILVYDISDSRTIDSLIEETMQVIELGEADESNCTVAICGNKSDTHQDPAMDDKLFKLTNRLNYIRLKYQRFILSSKQNTGIDKLHQYILKESSQRAWKCQSGDTNSDLNSQIEESFTEKAIQEDEEKSLQKIQSRNTPKTKKANDLKRSFAQHYQSFHCHQEDIEESQQQNYDKSCVEQLKLPINHSYQSTNIAAEKHNNLKSSQKQLADDHAIDQQIDVKSIKIKPRQSQIQAEDPDRCGNKCNLI